MIFGKKYTYTGIFQPLSPLIGHGIAIDYRTKKRKGEKKVKIFYCKLSAKTTNPKNLLRTDQLASSFEGKQIRLIFHPQ